MGQDDRSVLAADCAALLLYKSSLTARSLAGGRCLKWKRGNIVLFRAVSI